MSETADGFVATFKGGKGYDAPWIVVHAPTAADLDRQLGELTVDLLTRVGGISEVFQNLAAGGSAAPANTGSAPSSQPAAAAPQSAPPAASNKRFHPEGRKCSACQGPLYYQEWTAKSGKFSKAYKCDGKGMGHDIDWAS